MTLALRNKYSDKVEFIIANIDTPQGKQLSQEFNVYLIPSYFFIKNRQVTDHLEGKVDGQTLENQIKLLYQH